MSFSMPMAALLTLAATGQGPQGGEKPSAVAPFVGDEVAVIVRLDLAKWSAPASSRRLLGKLVDDADVADVARGVDAWLEAMKKAGAKELFLLVDPADMPGYPVAVVPIAAGADGRAIADVLKSGGAKPPVRWPASETIRGAVVAGSADALARIRDLKSGARPELAAALAAGAEATIQIAMIPSSTQRRAFEESMPTLSPQLGGSPITTLTRGLSWASIILTIEPRPTVRLVVQAKDVDDAKAIRKLSQLGLAEMTQALRSNPSTSALADAVTKLNFEEAGDRLTLEADLDKSAALVSVPIFQFREATRRSQCVNNLKQIGLAMHNYHGQHNTFPPAYIASKDGKPLLSWRVLTLPFIEQQELFNQFHLDESWDSPHNKTLIARMPSTYACPSGSKSLAAEGKTAYLTPRGPDTLFKGAEGVKIQEVTDGTSNTIFVVDAADDLAVIWTKPDDWQVITPIKTQRLFGHHLRGTNFLFADGAVRFLKETISQKVLQALTTHAGGEIISSDDY